MHMTFLHLLRCPWCGGHLSPAGIEPRPHEPRCEILTCWCGRYPVIAGIPILKRSPGGTLDKVIALIETGRHRQALLAMIAPASPELAPAWIQSLPRSREFSWLKHTAHRWALPSWREQAATLLTDQRRQVTVCTVLDFYFKQRENYNYFYFRFGQPRHLVGLSFASLIGPSECPILDLACGMGHLTQSLVARANGQPVIGVDQAFFGLYIAKHWIAPEAEYVCCTVDNSLPFADTTFSVAFCSDAFHYLINKTASIRELMRLTRPDGLILLVWVHNALARCPYDGWPLPPQGYDELLADIPHRLVADSDVLTRYRQKQGPALAAAVDASHLAQAPLLSLVASHRQATFQDYGAFDDWPHAKGHIGLNPLYAVEGQDKLGTIHLRRRFPSVFYEEDHAECKDYLPETAEVPLDSWMSVLEGRRTPEMEPLIERCVLLGMPERYRGN